MAFVTSTRCSPSARSRPPSPDRALVGREHGARRREHSDAAAAGPPPLGRMELGRADGAAAFPQKEHAGGWSLAAGERASACAPDLGARVPCSSNSGTLLLTRAPVTGERMSSAMIRGSRGEMSLAELVSGLELRTRVVACDPDELDGAPARWRAGPTARPASASAAHRAPLGDRPRTPQADREARTATARTRADTTASTPPTQLAPCRPLRAPGPPNGRLVRRPLKSPRPRRGESACRLSGSCH
jgi:hypothetical protein